MISRCFLTNGILIGTRVGFELTTPAPLATTPRHYPTQTPSPKCLMGFSLRDNSSSGRKSFLGRHWTCDEYLNVGSCLSCSRFSCLLGDCCAERLFNFDVKVGIAAWSSEGLVACVQQGRVEEGANQLFPCNPTVLGRYLFVKQNLPTVFSLCEVEVFGYFP